MGHTNLRILLVEDNPGDADLLTEGLSGCDDGFHVVHVECMEQAERRLPQQPAVDAILLDLDLPDSAGLDSLERAARAAPHLPIVVLTGLDDEAIGMEAVRKGAQDYLVKGRTAPPLLVRAIHYATERKHLEESLRHSEQRFRMVADNTYDWEFWVDPQGRFVYSSPSCERITGHTPAEFIADPELRMQLVHPEDRGEFHRHRQESEERRVAGKGEWRFLAPDGSWRWIAHVCQPVYDDHGVFLGVRGNNRDITDRKRAEEEVARLNQDLQRRVAELQTIFETVPIGLAIAEDASGLHIRGNPANEQMLGVQAGGELSKAGPSPAGYRCLHQGRELAVGELPMQRAVRGATVSGQILDVVREDGQEITVFCSASPLFDERGKPRGAVGASLNITSLKRAEERARILSEVTAQLLASDRPQRIVEALCRRVMEHLGCHVFFNFLVDEERNCLRLNACAGVSAETARDIERLEYGAAVCGCVARDGCRVVAEHIQTTPDSRTDLVRAFGIQAYACHPLLDQGRTIGTLSFGSKTKPAFNAEELGLMKDVADHVAIAMQRIRLLESLDRHARAAQAANEAKSRFLANMSHELRTPMNAILGMIDVALRRAADATVQDCLQTAKGSADLLLTLLNDLLDSARIESGKLKLESAPFSLRRMLDQITRAFSVRAGEKGLSFRCRIPADVPDAVLGDRMRLQQVLLNLAGNAVKFTEHGAVEVRVAAPGDLPQGEGEMLLEFAVSDAGIGIPASDLENIFQPFVQADASMARRFGGTGLGLSISKSLVEMMGGRIWVESRLGQGSTFFFTVRLQRTEEIPADSETPQAVPHAVAPLRVLLVEDNPANQKLARYLLQERGHAVEIARTGQEALSLSERGDYDVILMDVQMPGMNGLEATAAIRQREAGRRRVPIVAMTAHAMNGDRDRCLAAGMDGYLSKPVKAPEMIGLVESLARRPASAAPPPVAAPGPVEAPPSATAVVFNPDEAVKRCFNSRDMVREMIRCFFEEADKLLPQMRAALANNDFTELGQLGHRLKGTVVYLGADPARRAALRVERFCMSDGSLASDAEDAVNALERECRTLETALRDHPLAKNGE